MTDAPATTTPATTPAGHHRVVLVRHGATEWSESRRHTGTTDIPLTEAGERGARTVATALAGQAFAAVLTSPLQRARRTCELAGFDDHDPPPELVADLVEWDYGDYEGITTAQIRAHDPGWTVWSGAVPGGETLADVAARADRVVERLRTIDGDTLVFAHGHLLRILAARWCDLPPATARHLLLDPARPSVLGWEHEYPAIQSWNPPAV